MLLWISPPVLLDQDAKAVSGLKLSFFLVEYKRSEFVEFYQILDISPVFEGLQLAGSLVFKKLYFNQNPGKQQNDHWPSHFGHKCVTSSCIVWM